MLSTWHSLDAEADAAALTTEKAEPEACTLLYQAISTLADGFAQTDITKTDAADAQMGLFSQNLNSLKCSIDLAKRGYYTQSTGLLRGIHQNWIAFHYLAHNPAKADLWLCADKKTPSHSKMLKQLGPGFIEDQDDVRGWYDMLCHFTHPSALVILPHFGTLNGEPCVFFGVNYKPDLFLTCTCAICLYTSIMLREVSQLVPADAAWHQRYNTTMDDLQKFIKQGNVDLRTPA